MNDSFFLHCGQEKSQKQTLIQPFGAAQNLCICASFSPFLNFCSFLFIIFLKSSLLYELCQIIHVIKGELSK